MNEVFVTDAPRPESEELAAPSTREREAAIFQVLRQAGAEEGLAVREIAERARDYLRDGSAVPAGPPPAGHRPKHDTVTVQAYHKLVQRLVALGRLEEVPACDTRCERRYRAAPYLHASQPLTLDDIYEWALQPGLRAQLPPSEFIAHLADAGDYLGEKKRDVLKEAAEALTREDPREIFFRMICHHVELLRHDLAIYADPRLRDAEIKARVTRAVADLGNLLYRMLGIPPEAVDLTEAQDLLRGAAARGSRATPRPLSDVTVRLDERILRAALLRRVFGAHFLAPIDVGATRGSAGRQRLTVAGSDGSTHASHLQVRTAREYFEEDEMVVTFNNAMVYVHQSSAAAHRSPTPYHSVPMTRTALDNPDNRGMIVTGQARTGSRREVRRKLVCS